MNTRCPCNITTAPLTPFQAVYHHKYLFLVFDINITLYQTDRHLRNNSDWNCGDNIWLIQWFAPLGHSHQMRSAVRQLFPNTTVRALYHKGSDKGLRILTFKT